jgi:hypothetical protein
MPLAASVATMSRCSGNDSSPATMSTLNRASASGDTRRIREWKSPSPSAHHRTPADRQLGAKQLDGPTRPRNVCHGLRVSWPRSTQHLDSDPRQRNLVTGALRSKAQVSSDEGDPITCMSADHGPTIAWSSETPFLELLVERVHLSSLSSASEVYAGGVLVLPNIPWVVQERILDGFGHG